jgi:hypothetical protein
MFSGQVMSHQARHLRIPLIALVAMTGILWSVPVVKAASPPETKARACCARHAGVKCGCCSVASERPAVSARSSDILPSSRLTTIVASSCETCVCAPNSPANQGERRETRTAEERASEASSGPLAFESTSNTPPVTSPAVQSRPLPSSTPIYLRVERLTI